MSKVESRFSGRFSRKRYYAPLPQAGEVVVQQHFKNDCDIRHIIARYTATGLRPHAQGTYGDFTGFKDIDVVLARFDRAKSLFMSLSADVRSRFNNNPFEFFDFASNPANKDQLRDFGLEIVDQNLHSSSDQKNSTASGGVDNSSLDSSKGDG